MKSDISQNMAQLMEDALKMQSKMHEAASLRRQIMSTAKKHGLTDSREDLERLRTIEQLRNIDLALKNTDCIQAIKDGRVTVHKLAEMDVHDLEQAIERDDYPTPGKTLK